MPPILPLADPSQATPFSSYTPRVAIVTGSSQGIGYEIAHRLADDGIDVVINDISSKQAQIDKVVEELRKKGGRALGIPADVSKEADVISLVEKSAQELGGVDIMIANAGISHVNSFLDTTIETFDTIYSINMRGVFLCYKHAALQMIKQGRGGRLIGASSSAGKQGTQNLLAYSGTKFAVRGMTQAASIELYRHGITANAYAPGLINTPLGKPTLIFDHPRDRDSDTSGPNLGLSPDGVNDNCATIKRLFGVPDAPVSDADTVASMISYLVKPEAYFVNGGLVYHFRSVKIEHIRPSTGQTISIDGGFRYS
ncbi:NAD-binding protein [Fomitiporia mediterranea MF3/22]|uniref:NAD-binding protein n=1 Tax=Fomitiporia mediterranea (strain MF3/22) TaxID=694068 RepID=UPI00044078DE|nr:NAD-binding protein [Fomitiporia mediterranea MF3/22]EJD06777.1 NAD-binding protein [Fomitiporia mediterranea MF3/22]